jgi:PAS domain S-box-containing protein
MADEPLITVLVVDDDEAKRYAITKMLRKAGFAIREAATGGEALRLVADLPDLVILDVKLPDVSGFDVCRRIKADPATASIPVLHLSTTFVGLDDKVQGLEGGADAYLTDVLEPLELIATVRSLLRTRRAEEAAQISNRQWQVTFDAVNDGVILLDPEGKVSQVNQAMQEILQRPWTEIHGKSLHEILELPDGKDSSPFLRMIQSQTREVAEVTLAGRWLHIAVDPVRNPPGGVRGALCIISDVTDRRRMEEELRRRAEELAIADRRKDEFLAMLAHELRNPLAPIRNCLEVLKRQWPNGPGLPLPFEIAQRQLKHMARLLDDLLDVSRFSQGKIELKKSTVDFATVVSHAVEACTPLVEAKGHHLSVTLPAQAVQLDADSTRLEQVLANLLNNAAKYTEPGGEVTLAAEREGDELVIRVTDNGIGLSDPMLSRVFDLFAQADISLDRTQGGLGIGLTLARSLVELHGGTIGVRSEGLGRGSEFTVRLPVREPAPARVPVETAADPREGSERLNILVVDDHRDSATSLAYLLTYWGHQVQLAHGGPEAIDLVSSTSYDVVLLDIGLPEMDGYEVAARIKAGPENGRIALVALTGYGSQQDRLRSEHAGFDYHLVKPFDPDTLVGLLSEWSSRKSRERVDAVH